MTMTKSHWLPRRVFLGIEARHGAMPIAFESMAAARAWAAVVPDSVGAEVGRRVWSMAVRPTTRVYRVTRVPATTKAEVSE